jgi:transcriptional regulator with XRE-family HTH domain
MNLGKYIKFRRLRRGLTQKQVAERIGFSRSAYANLENGYRAIKPHMAAIKKALHR